MVPDCRVEGGAEGRRLRLDGVWRLPRLVELRGSLQALPLAPSRKASPRAGEGAHGASITLDGSGLEAIDTAAALLLLRHLEDAGIAADAIVLDGFSDSHRRIVEVVRQRLPLAGPQHSLASRGMLGQLGAASVATGRLVGGHVAFLGLVTVEIGRLLARPAAFRPRELGSQLRQVCVSAIPVVVLVTFLIGTIVAYLLGQQAEKFGANIFVVDGVALGMVREFAPIIVATIVAGRSGAAFTAQLGTMKLNQEIDAIRTLGLSAEQVLVVPRVLALMIALPLLVFVGDVAGLAGAMGVADLMLGITPTTFLERMQSALTERHFLIGLAKAPVFALFIAVIGCRMGLDVSRDTRAIGLHTTSTVVQCIVVVILLDALFAVLLQELGL
jgi:phospholipid/cholesterol/gamma-HCH transport system permease protein